MSHQCRLWAVIDRGMRSWIGVFAVFMLVSCGNQERAANVSSPASSPAPPSAATEPVINQQSGPHTTGLIAPADLEARVRAQRTIATRFTGVIRATVSATSVCNASAQSVDLMSLGFVSDVQDQKTCGACWAFATVGSYESSYKVQNNKGPVNASEQQVIDCSGAGKCTGGWWAFDYFRDRGDGSRSDVAYTATDAACPLNPKSLYRAVNWDYINSCDPTAQTNCDPMATKDQIKAALCEHGAVVTAFNATPTFIAHSGTAVFKETNNRTVNHGIVIVGWDDTKSAWRIKNSWGTGWGDQGFAWVDYGTNNIGFGAAWVESKKDSVDVPARLTTILPTTAPMPQKGAMATLAR